VPRIEAIDLVVLLDIDRAAVLRAPSVVGFHAMNEC
jgi:hypothetical protein